MQKQKWIPHAKLELPETVIKAIHPVPKIKNWIGNGGYYSSKSKTEERRLCPA